MDSTAVVICLSAGLQLAAALLAAKLLLLPGRRIVGIIALTVILLMAFRRFVSLYRLMTGGAETDFFAEGVALTISLLLLIGILALSRIIRSEAKMASMLSESRKHYRILFDQSPDGVLLSDMKGRILECNETAAQNLGYTREEFLRLRLSDIDPVEADTDIQERIEDAATKGKAQFEVKHRTKGGGIRDVHVFTQLVESDGDKVFLTIWRDITERLDAERRLRESEDRFRSFFEQAIDGIMIADLENKKQIEANRAICSMLGYTREELLNLHVEGLHPKADLPRILDLFERQTRGEISLAPDVPMLKKDGTVVYVDVNAAVITLNGRPCLIGIFRDITERKQADAALRERERQLAESQRIAHIGSWEHNLTTGKVVWSDELFRLLGLDPRKDPADFKMFFDMIHPDDRPALKKAIDKTVQTGEHFSIDYRFILRDGRTRILHAQAELKRDETGTQSILSGTGQDITERKQAEEKIRQSEEFVRSILDTVDEGFIVVDLDFRILTANRAYCSQVGGASDEIVGRHCFETSHKSLTPCYLEGEDCAVRRVFDTGEPHMALHRHKDATGGVLYVETKAFPIKNGSGVVTSVIETVNNISERHLLEAERLKSKKLEAIGTLAGGIAHDFNNLLQGIFGYISMAKMTIAEKERSLAMLEQAEQALHMAVNLTTQLLTFSKGGKPVKKIIDLRPLIENSARFALSGSSADYRIDVDDDLWAVEADEGQIGQVVQNIVLNADQAMPEGGTIVITAGNLQTPKRDRPQLAHDKRYVEISVRDGGIGIPRKYLQKIFDPYFTTKEKGSGLGLATSYSVIKNHGGIIDVVSEPGRGTTFLLYLPAIRVEREMKEASAVSSIVRKGKILVMDDEELIRNIAGSLVKILGHEVDVAENGESAVAKYVAARESGRPFDIVILDLTVRGGQGGRETIERLRAINPGVRAIVSSGYSDDAVLADSRNYGFMGCLSKPYNIEALRETLNALLKTEA